MRASVLVTLCLLVAGAVATGRAAEPAAAAATGAAAAAAAATGATGAAAPALDVSPAASLVDKVIAQTKELADEEAKLCATEQASTKEWSASVDPDAAKSSLEKRMKDKRALADALGERLKTLDTFLKKLYTARQRLGDHIHRVNSIFQTAYAANTETQSNAAEAMKELGLSLSQPHSPTFNPIKLPAHEVEADKAEAAKLEAEEQSATGGAAADASDAAPAAGDDSAAAAAAAAQAAVTPSTDVEPITPDTPNTPEDTTTTTLADAPACTGDDCPPGNSDKADTEAAEDASADVAASDVDAASTVKDAAAGDEILEQATADAKQVEQQAEEALGSTTLFMELEARVHAAAALCTGKSCNVAYTGAFKLYKQAYELNKANAVHFENERASLGGFRDGLKALIKKKEAKMAALTKQLKELQQALADPGPTLLDLFPLIDKHLAVNKEACSKMGARTKSMLELDAQLLEHLRNGALDCAGPAAVAPVDTSSLEDATGGDAPVPPPEPPVEEEPTEDEAATDAVDSTQLEKELTKPSEDVEPEAAKPDFDDSAVNTHLEKIAAPAQPDQQTISSADLLDTPVTAKTLPGGAIPEQ